MFEVADRRSEPPLVATQATPEFDECADSVLTPPAREFLAALARRFGGARREILRRRQEVQSTFDDGWLPGFRPETASIRDGDWRIAAVPRELADRRVEITGPVDRKMIINGLNSGANVFMADFEDSCAPTWANVITGHANLIDAVAGSIDYVDPARGRTYALNSETSVLMVRPRGWHLDEAHIEVDGEPVPASLFDFGLFVFHNAYALLAKGSAVYVYLPKLESHLEAALWRDVFVFAETRLGLPRGAIRATVLIETLPAAFEMDEILHELRDHVAGLNCGRWDYIFSIIKKFRNRRDFLLPDRATVTMDSPALRAYSRLLIQTCHRRGAHAMGGMAAQIPIRGNAEANVAALAKVRADKEREVRDGHDGTWVAHPDLVPVARAVFDLLMSGPNQVNRGDAAQAISPDSLLRMPAGAITEAGLRLNIRVGVQYLEAWLRGTGCVPLYNLMEDAATAEICRSQVWQWVRHQARMDDGRTVTDELVRRTLDAEVEALRAGGRGGATLAEAVVIFLEVALPPGFEDFLTHRAYQALLGHERAARQGAITR